MEFDQRPEGRAPLPFKSVDTGLGLERLASVVQGAATNYDTDLFTPILARMRELLGHDPDAFESERFSYQVIADHSRAITFLIADGVLPANEGRGYVLRRIVRRAVRHGRLLGRREPFLVQTATVVIESMGDAYPQLRERQEAILGAILREETAFARTLDAGTVHLEEALIPLTGAERVIGRLADALPSDAPVLPGDVAFRLHDTYGFPIDLTVELAGEYGVRVDRAGFETALEEQRVRSRTGKSGRIPSGGGDRPVRRHRPVDWRHPLPGLRHDRLRRVVWWPSRVTQRRTRNSRPTRGRVAGRRLPRAELVLDQTPFYAERGGQVGDTGVPGRRRTSCCSRWKTPSGRSAASSCTGARCTAASRSARRCTAVVDAKRRAHTMRNHTATHLLHRAVRNAVGASARQAGSLVAPDYLRFDFPFDRALTDEERHQIQDEVRAIVRDDLPVTARVMTMQEAVDGGADAFFDEKYGEQVRTIRVEGYDSFELCGGTHCRASGQVGGFIIVSERSIGSGMRRIEAVTGGAADQLTDASRHSRELLPQPVPRPRALPQRVEELQTRARGRAPETKRGSRLALWRAVDRAPANSRRGHAPGRHPLRGPAAPFASVDEMKSYGKDVRDALGRASSRS